MYGKFQQVVLLSEILGEEDISELWSGRGRGSFGVEDAPAMHEQKILETIETFLGLGVSRDEFKTMIKRFPHCIAYSAESMKEKFEFLVKKMNWPLEALVLIPTIIGYSMEKRIVPRCNVIKALMSKGLIGSVNPPISSVLICTDDEFLKRYVMKHGKLVPELMDIFTGRLVS